MSNGLKIFLKILYFLIKLGVLFTAGIFSFLYFAFLGFTTSPNVFFASISLFVAAGLLFVAWFLPFKKVRKVRKGFFFSGLAVALAGVIAISACIGYNSYLDSITIVDNSAIITDDYLAFKKDSKIARLDGEASLRFSTSTNLPVVDGAAAFFPLYSSFVEAVYPSNIPPLNREDSPYQFHNTIPGYYSLVDKDCDILFAFGPDENQLSYAERNGVEYELIPIGGEGFVFFTNTKNPVNDLTVEQIRSIYAGKITNWKEVGGENTKILPYQRNRGSGSQTALIEFMGDTPLMEPPTELVNSFMWGIIEEIADYQNHRGAIGFSFHNYAEEIVANQNIKLLSVSGVAPTPENIADGSYPVTMPFYMVVRKEARSKKMQLFIDWVLSEEGQFLVKASGFAPVLQ